MGRRRSRIKQEINKLLYTSGNEGFKVVYIDRSRETGARLKELTIERIERVTEWAIYLDDGDTVIPLHRIVEIRDREGRIVWRRSGEKDTR